MAHHTLLYGHVVHDLFLAFHWVVLDPLYGHLLFPFDGHHLDPLHGHLLFPLHGDVLGPLYGHLFLPLDGHPVALLDLDVVGDTLFDVVGVFLGDVIDPLFRDNLASLLLDVVSALLLYVLSPHLGHLFGDGFVDIVDLGLVPDLGHVFSDVLNGVVVLHLLLHGHVFHLGHRLVLNIGLLEGHLLVDTLSLNDLMAVALLPVGGPDDAAASQVVLGTGVLLGTDDPAAAQGLGHTSSGHGHRTTQHTGGT